MKLLHHYWVTYCYIVSKKNIITGMSNKGIFAIDDLYYNLPDVCLSVKFGF